MRSGQERLQRGVEIGHGRRHGALAHRLRVGLAHRDQATHLVLEQPEVVGVLLGAPSDGRPVGGVDADLHEVEQGDDGIGHAGRVVERLADGEAVGQGRLGQRLLGDGGSGFRAWRSRIPARTRPRPRRRVLGWSPRLASRRSRWGAVGAPQAGDQQRGGQPEDGRCRGIGDRRTVLWPGISRRAAGPSLRASAR